MDRSAILAQALQSMGQQPAIQAPPPPDLAAIQRAGQAKQAWEAANPGQSYMGHNLQQMGQNVMDAPGKLMAAPGNAMGGLADLAKRLGVGGQAAPAMAPQPGAPLPPY